jgi:hypothetical protein
MENIEKLLIHNGLEIRVENNRKIISGNLDIIPQDVFIKLSSIGYLFEYKK